MLPAVLVAAFSLSGAAHAKPGCHSRACEARVAAKHARWNAKWCNRHRACRERVAIRRYRLCGSPSCNRRLGRYMTTHRYGARAWGCVYPIIDQESHWNHRQWNTAGSGAYGIPQALPAGKMASVGGDYMTNPVTQIRWMFGYFDARYGGPCGALAHKRATGWY